ncbi:polysaccharide deacetylase [Streptomyces sp. SLBN-31]|nr:polysaccharide deacetylase [Streptomyces sp. SLBN-31]
MSHAPGSPRSWQAAGMMLPLAMAAAHIGPAATWLPGVCRLLFPRLSGSGHWNHVALTFDDGPDPRSTPRFLDALEDLDVRATFFVLGESVARHPALAQETVQRGHELAVHGWIHDRPWRPSPAPDAAEIACAVHTVRDVTGSRPHWYRPPYGILTSGRWMAARRAGLRPVLWTAWGKDWAATPLRPPYGRRSKRIYAAAARSCCTTPTEPPPPARGTPPSVRCPASSTTAIRPVCRWDRWPSTARRRGPHPAASRSAGRWTTRGRPSRGCIVRFPIRVTPVPRPVRRFQEGGWVSPRGPWVTPRLGSLAGDRTGCGSPAAACPSWCSHTRPRETLDHPPPGRQERRCSGETAAAVPAPVGTAVGSMGSRQVSDTVAWIKATRRHTSVGFRTSRPG